MTDDDFPDLHDVETGFDRQVADGLADTTTPLELLASLDERAFASLPSHGEDDSNSPYPLEAWSRLFLFREISGMDVDPLIDHLEDNRDEAAMLGFDTVPDGQDSPVPDQSTASRAWNGDRLDPDDRLWVARKAERILEIVHERGNPMGLRVLDPEDKEETSQSTQYRHRHEKRNEAAQNTAEMAADVYNFGRAANAKYPMEEFMRAMAKMSCEAKTARDACRLDDDPVEGVNRKPKGETLRAHVNDLDPADLVEMHDAVAELLVGQMKQHLEFDRPVEAAIDIVPVELPGKPGKTDEAIEDIGEIFDELDDDAVGQFVQGVKEEDSDALCYKFITLNIVGQHFRIPLVVRPVPKGVPRATLVRELYWQAREMVSIDTLYLDAGFYSADGLQSVNEAEADYVMSAPKDERLKRWLADVDCEVAVKHDHSVFGPIKGAGREYVQTTIVAKPSIQNPDKTVLFATSKDVDDEIGLDRESASEEMDEYSNRGHQEKSYEMLKKFLAPTESKSFRIHLFYFCFAALAYSMWKLVDFRTKKDIGIDPEESPVVEFSEFLNTMGAYLERMLPLPG
jgi:hypothetical protein